MTFLWSHMLVLTIAPVLILLLDWKRRRRHSKPVRDLPNVRRGAVEGGRVRFDADAVTRSPLRWRLWLAVLLVIVALARPQWGSGPQATHEQSGEVLIALDLSQSMLAHDVAPSRLERGRAIAAELAQDLPDQKIGLIAFAGTAHVVAPPAEDRSLFNAFLSTLFPRHIVDQGTDFARLLDVAAGAFTSDARQRRLVVISDGEAESESWRGRLAELQSRGIAVVAIGVGTSEGAIIPGADGRPLRDSFGSPVRSRIEAASLKELAGETGGEYFDERDAADAAASALSRYDEATGTAQEHSQSRRADRFVHFLIAASLLLAWSARTEWLARPKIHRPLAGAAAAGLALLLVPGLLHPQTASATELHDEQDPLEVVQTVVSRLIDQPELHAPDYLEFVEAATRYGEVQRGFAQPLSEGVLRDALVAVDRGRRLDPSLADWKALGAKLRRLLIPPPPVRDQGSTLPDAADERVDAKREVQVVDSNGPERPTPGGQSEDAEALSEQQSTQSVGGSRRDRFEAAEWGNASLAMPLYQLERIRGTASPAELFRLMQKDPADAGEGQTW